MYDLLVVNCWQSSHAYPQAHENQGSIVGAYVKRDAETYMVYLFHTEKVQLLLNKLTSADWKLMSTG